MSPDSFVGWWAGEISEDLPDHKTYGAQLTIDRGGNVGGVGVVTPGRGSATARK